MIFLELFFNLRKITSQDLKNPTVETKDSSSTFSDALVLSSKRMIQSLNLKPKYIEPPSESSLKSFETPDKITEKMKILKNWKYRLKQLVERLSTFKESIPGQIFEAKRKIFDLEKQLELNPFCRSQTHPMIREENGIRDVEVNYFIEAYQLSQHVDKKLRNVVLRLRKNILCDSENLKTSFRTFAANLATAACSVEFQISDSLYEAALKANMQFWYLHSSKSAIDSLKLFDDKISRICEYKHENLERQRAILKASFTISSHPMYTIFQKSNPDVKYFMRSLNKLRVDESRLKCYFFIIDYLIENKCHRTKRILKRKINNLKAREP